jgi:hydrogenase maturation protease
MNQPLLDGIAQAVLYEGYVLYPYRPSVKSRQRWTFGILHPRSFSEAHGDYDSWATQTECLMQGDENTVLRVRLRFLHIQERVVGELYCPRPELPVEGEPAFHVVDRLQVGDRLLLSWQEAVEQEHRTGGLSLASLLAREQTIAFHFADHRQVEPVRGPRGNIVAVLVRRRRALTGAIAVSATAAVPGLFKVQVRVENHTPMDDAGRQSRADALLHSLVSTHTVLNLDAGEFVSLLDPPDPWRAAAASCHNVGTWPVLVGENGEKDTMLSAPIILYDYPRIAPESQGDLFDGTEIDEILSLRILTLSEPEKQAAAAVDERVSALLSRTQALTPDQMLGLHGAMRGLRLVEEGGTT